MVIDRTFWSMYQAALAMGTAGIVGHVHASYAVLQPGRPCPFMTPIRRFLGRQS